jgi:hypothetical protein
MNARVAEIMAANDIEVRFDEDNNVFALKVGEYRTLIQEDGEFAKEFKVFMDKKDKNLRHIKAGKEHVTDLRITQFHEAKDKDIKLISGKVGDYSVKLIYHRMSKGDLQYRIFVAFKEGGKLRRIRLRNEFTDANEANKDKMLKYVQGIIDKKDVATLAEVKAQ